MANFSLLADWNFPNDEVQAAHFEDIRRYCWAIDWAFGNLLKSDDEWNPLEYDGTTAITIDGHAYGYIIGSLCQYAGEWWVSERNFNSPAENTPPPTGWRLFPRHSKYHDYDANAQRFMCVGHGLMTERFLLQAYKFLPPQLTANTQIFQIAWQRFKYFWEGDKVFVSNPVTGIRTYYECLADHRSSVRFDLDSAKWRQMNASEILNPAEPSPHHTPVAYDSIVSGIVGAIMSRPLQWGGPTPWPDQYNYYGENQPPDEQYLIGKYVNPKLGTAYQSHIEYLCNKFHPCWPGRSHWGETDLYHVLGEGYDPSGNYYGTANSKFNFPFNFSAFEEILYLATEGRHDWYLDINCPPETQGWPKSVACWRRTPENSMELPVGISETTKMDIMQLNSIPTAATGFSIDDVNFEYRDPDWPGYGTFIKAEPYYYIPTDYIYDWQGFDDDDDLVAIQDWYYNITSELPYDPVNGYDRKHLTIVNTILAIMLANKGITVKPYRFFTVDQNGDPVTPYYYEMMLTYAESLDLTFTWTGTPWQNIYAETFGGVKMMWPHEWGYPPEPATNWGDVSAVIDVIDDVALLWDADEEFLQEFEARHTCNFSPKQNYNHPEIVKQILIDMKSCLDYVRYVERTVGLCSWPTAKTVDLSGQHFNSYTAAIAAVKAQFEGEWSIAGSLRGSGISGEDMAGYAFYAVAVLNPEVGATDMWAEISGSASSWAIAAHSEALYDRGIREVALLLGIEDKVGSNDPPAIIKPCNPSIEDSNASVVLSNPQYHYSLTHIPLSREASEQMEKKMLDVNDTTSANAVGDVWNDGQGWSFPDNLGDYSYPSTEYIYAYYNHPDIGASNVEHVHATYVSGANGILVHCNPFDAPIDDLPHLGAG